MAGAVAGATAGATAVVGTRPSAAALRKVTSRSGIDTDSLKSVYIIAL